MLNKVTLVGRLTEDVKVNQTQSGVAVANFTLAVRRNFKDQNGEYDTDFIRCVVWRKQAENLANYQGKGDLIGLSGQIETDSYTDRETGKTVYTTTVRAEEIVFLSPSKKPQGVQQSQGGYGQQPYNQNFTQMPQQQAGYGQAPVNQGYGQTPPNGYQQTQQPMNQGFNQAPQQGGGQIDIGDDDLPF